MAARRHLRSHGKIGDCEQSLPARVHYFCHPKSPLNLHDVLLINLSQPALDSYYYQIYGCILRGIIRSAHHIKSFLPYKDRIIRSQMSKVVYKAIVVGTARISILEKQNVDHMTEKLNILKRSRQE